MVKLENKKKIGILGGTFDPPHKGHLQISIEAKKQFKINYIIWAVTKKNPFKKKSLFSLKKRISLAKNLTYKKKYISIRYFEDKTNSNKTHDLIKFIKKKYKSYELYYIMGADNLISFHKWYKWNAISSICKILVF